jgi:hypothetical protein
MRRGVTVEQLDRAIRTGLLAVRDAAGRSFVCAGCVRDLLVNNKLQ